MKSIKFIIKCTKYSFFGVILFFSCSVHITPYQSLKKEINKNPNFIKYKNKNVNNLHFIIPKNIDDTIQRYLQKSVSEDLETEYCSNEEASIEITYEITFSTDVFFSIKKEVKTMFCYQYDDIYKDFINLLTFRGGLYMVNIKDSSHIKQLVDNYFSNEDLDLDCEYDQGGYQLNLSLEKNKAYIYLVKDKVCYLKIPIEIDEKIFDFVVLQ